MIIADGQVTRPVDLPLAQFSKQEQDTMQAIMEARCPLPSLCSLPDSIGGCTICTWHHVFSCFSLFHTAHLHGFTP